MPNTIMELSDVKSVGINSWGEIDKYLLPIDWGEWAAKSENYVKQWEDEILRKRWPVLNASNRVSLRGEGTAKV